MAKEWEVIVPIIGYATKLVEAETEAGTIRNAIDTVDVGDIESWQGVKDIVQGSVFHGKYNTASATPIED